MEAERPRGSNGVFHMGISPPPKACVRSRRRSHKFLEGYTTCASYGAVSSRQRLNRQAKLPSWRADEPRNLAIGQYRHCIGPSVGFEGSGDQQFQRLVVRGSRRG